MFTVVIAEPEIIENMKQNRIFLKPFLENPEIAFCAWHTEETTLHDMVPQLYAAVGSRLQWRALVVCDEQGIHEKNPFDFSKYRKPDRKLVEDGSSDGFKSEEDAETYFKRIIKEKCDAYERAAHNSLTRLGVCLFHEQAEEETDPSDVLMADPAYVAYIEELKQKRKVIREIRAGQVTPLAEPTEILCVARRTYEHERYDLEVAWRKHGESEYSAFADWNLYYPEMRFLVYDIHGRHEKSYEKDFLKFQYILMLLAENEAPKGALKAERVYQICSQEDNNALSRMLQQQSNRLDRTINELSQLIRKTERHPQKGLTDKEVKAMFCAETRIPVAIPKGAVDKERLYPSKSGWGLTTDLPSDEKAHWSTLFAKSKDEFAMLLKQPRRALKQAVGAFRDANSSHESSITRINEFQREDIVSYIESEESEMLRINPRDLQAPGTFTGAMEAADQKVRARIATRMTHKSAVVLSTVALLTMLLGFIPAIVAGGDRFGAFEMAVLALLLLAVCGAIFLLSGRYELLLERKSYDRAVDAAVRDVDATMQQYSNYLTHACNVMRGYSALTYYEENKNPEDTLVKIYRKHYEDVIQAKTELLDQYAAFLEEAPAGGLINIGPFQYDFTLPVDYSYDVSYSRKMAKKIVYMQKGCEIEVPFDYIQYVVLKREELYD